MLCFRTLPSKQEQRIKPNELNSAHKNIHLQLTVMFYNLALFCFVSFLFFTFFFVFLYVFECLVCVSVIERKLGQSKQQPLAGNNRKNNKNKI